MTSSKEKPSALADLPAPIQSRAVEVLDNGAPAGSASVGPDGNWQLELNNLTEGLHSMTASSGGVTSGQWNVNVQATSGSEEWRGITAQQLGYYNYYFTKSGLCIACYPNIYDSSNTTARFFIYKGVMVLGAQTTSSYARRLVLTCFLPTTATRVTLSFEQAVPTEGSIVLGDANNFRLTFKLERSTADQSFLMPEGIRYFTLLGQASETYTTQIRKISWDNSTVFDVSAESPTV